MSFIHLSSGAKITLYSLEGRKIKTLNLPDQNGRVQWDLTTESGQSVAAGVYIYLISDPAGHKAQGKVAVLREYVF